MHVLSRIRHLLQSHSLLPVLLIFTVWILYAYICLPLDSSGNRSVLSLVLTANQQGLLYMKKGDYKKAAGAFSSTQLKAAALYRDGQFKDAAALFSTGSEPIALFNQGTALIMAGLYDEAISSLEKSLEDDPGLEDARINLEIAKIRKEKNLPPEDDHGGTGGMLEADEFVFDDRKSSGNQDQTEQVDSDAHTSDAQMRAMWLKRLESSPKDFLRVKFAYQNTIPEDQE